MANALNNSPFIKTTFVAIALVISSISSAAHAEDFLKNVSTQGLDQLSLDVNVLDSQDRVVCKENDQDPKRKAIEDEIARIKARMAVLQGRIPYSRNTIKGLKDDISRLERQLERAKDDLHAFRTTPTGGLSREQIEEILKELNKNIQFIEDAISKSNSQILILEANIANYQNELEQLRLQLIAAEEKLRVYDQRKAIACVDRR